MRTFAPKEKKLFNPVVSVKKPFPAHLSPRPAYPTSRLILQKKCACGGGCPKCQGEPTPDRHLQTKQSRENETDAVTATPIVHEVLRSPGQPLNPSTRDFMESRFARDFSEVRVHTGPRAAESADAVNALAYTVGRDLVFGAGQYKPETTEGKRLLAHELTHVIQQSTGLQARLAINQPGDQYEQEADRVADAVIGQTGTASPARHFHASGRSIQRQNGDKKKDEKKDETPSWTVEELKEMLDCCDGGLDIWATAKKAINGKDPQVFLGTLGASSATGQIILNKTLVKCDAVQELIMELSNVSRRADSQKLLKSAVQGDLDRPDFVRGMEEIEYEGGVKNMLTAFDACKETWKCATTKAEGARKVKNFDEYFTDPESLSASHKEYYGIWWDKKCKEAYDIKHPK